MKLLMENHNLANDHSHIEAIGMLKEAGFDAIDFSFYGFSPEKDILNLPNMREFAQSLRDYADSIGITFAQAHSPFAMKYGDAFDMSNKAYADIVRSFEFCSILGIPHTVVHAIKTPHDDPTIDYKAYNRRFYLSLLPYSLQYGVKIAVENLFWRDKKRGSFYGIFPTPAELCGFVDELDNPMFTCCVDLGHAAITGLEPEVYLGGMDSTHLGAVHIQDTDYRDDRHFLPFSAAHNWDKICKALAKIDYKGDFTLEILHFIDKYPTELQSEALKFAASVGRYLIGKVEDFKKELTV